MQLYALDSQKKLIFANHAIRQHDYACVECQQMVRLRGGPHRQNHYYHLSASSCRQNGKSMAHLQAQLRLYAVLGEHDCQLEVQFPQIKRIADVVWKSQKIIFEIQCSQITAAEVQQRNRDYGSVGYQVVWILNDGLFNKYRITAAESFLQNSTFYYTNINAEGIGVIYDQFDVQAKGLRKRTLKTFEVDISNLAQFCFERPAPVLPAAVKMRRKEWKLSFQGDMVERCYNAFDEPEIKEFIQEALGLEAEFQVQKEAEGYTLKEFLWYCLVKPYKLFFQIVLERACK